MPILFHRMVFHAEKEKVPLQPIEKRVELGKIMAAAYYVTGTEETLKLVPFTEQGKKYRVLLYPQEFMPQMDAIISKFYQDNPVKFRKKIPLKRPVASSKTFMR